MTPHRSPRTSAGKPPPDPAALTAAGQQNGAFPLKSGNADSALLVRLEPGAYTVIISGVNNTTGNCLVEIYEVR